MCRYQWFRKYLRYLSQNTDRAYINNVLCQIIVIYIVYGASEKIKAGEKRQIPIPVDKGRNLMGVLDETKQLKYGQVFIAYTHRQNEKIERRIVTGTNDMWFTVS